MAAQKYGDAEFVALWNDARREGKSLAQHARDIALDLRAVMRRRDKLRALGQSLPDFATAITHGQRIDQATLTHHEDWTAEQCKDSLRAVQAENPKRWITSRFYAHRTGVRDTTWNRYFGTFEEFCRQTGMGRTRQLSQFGKQIAKHVSVDHYREVGQKRTELGENYLRDRGGRWKTILGCNDLHDVECDPFWRRVFMDTVKRLQPDNTVINGDGLDLPEFGKYKQDPRSWNLAKRIKWACDLQRDIRMAAPDTQTDWIEGNHEYRFVRMLADTNPAMLSLLSEVHGMTVADALKLNEYETNYIAKADLAAYRVEDIKREIARNWRVYYGAVLAHHFPDGKRRGLAGWNGHHHSHIAQQFTSADRGVYEWHQFGCGHRRDATYCDGEAWGNGFGIWHVDTVTKATVCEYVPVTDFAVVGGRYYHRQPDECWHDEQIKSLQAA